MTDLISWRYWLLFSVFMFFTVMCVNYLSLTSSFVNYEMEEELKDFENEFVAYRRKYHPRNVYFRSDVTISASESTAVTSSSSSEVITGEKYSDLSVINSKEEVSISVTELMSLIFGESNITSEFAISTADSSWLNESNVLSESSFLSTEINSSPYSKNVMASEATALVAKINVSSFKELEITPGTLQFIMKIDAPLFNESKVILDTNLPFAKISPSLFNETKVGSNAAAFTAIDNYNLNPHCKLSTLDERVNCLPLKYLSRKNCLDVGCCWDENIYFTDYNIIPRCYFPTDSLGYIIRHIEKSDIGIYAILERIKPSGLPADVAKLNFSVTFNDVSLRIKITDLSSSRYEVPLPLSYESHASKPARLFDVFLSYDGSFSVKRKSSEITIFSTNVTKLLYADQLLQLTTRLPSPYIYGLGDHMGPLLKSSNWTKFTFFNRDQIPEMHMNLYSSFPFYMALEEDGSSHGVYLFNSNAMDVILQPLPAATFRTTGGILDFFIFLGPSPGEVVQQFTSLVGYPAMPPYWSLGFHLSRLGYFTLNKTVEVWKRTIDASIPFDTQWNDIDYMHNYNDFTYDTENFSGLPQFVNLLHKMGMHYVMIIDPGISSAETAGTYPPFDEGLAMDIFIKNASGQLLKTKVWNKISSVFPDFTNPSTMQYWKKQLSDFYSLIPFDGVWLDMNEPTNFLNGSFDGCPVNSSLEDPPYVPGTDPLRTKTICMTAKHYISSHYNIHNVYGIKETEITYRAMSEILNKRPFILSRAGFPGMGRFSAMWNGDVISSWEHMKASIPSILSYNMVGVPMIGADICGFNDNTTVELCARWSALGAFYPFSRNHNSDENIEQDPVALGPTVISAAKEALSVRYFLLPYLYTLLYFSHISGYAVARPLFFEYPKDVPSYSIDSQFLWGPALMIIPALEQGAKQVTCYLPPDTWYDFYTGEKKESAGENYTLDAPLDKINLAVRGGYILSAQVPNVTTTLSRKNNFMLIVALNNESKAAGILYWDDGESLDADTTSAFNLIQFLVENKELKTAVVNFGYETNMVLEGIQVFGVKRKPRKVLVNDESVGFQYEAENQVLFVLDLSISLLKENKINW